MRQIKWTLCLLSVSLLLTACNLGGPAQPEEEIPVEDLDAASQPTVTILSPADGSGDFVVDEEIPVSVSATDAIGVTRVQLFANGSLVRTVSSEFAEGEVSYEGVLNFTPRATGEFNLRVIAFRDSISSPPVQITVNVGDEDIVVTQRPGDTGNGTTGGNDAPVIPNDGVCRALTLVGLNFRAQPTTTRDNVITTFAQNTLLTVVGRLGDNSWWQVNSSAGTGWVSGNPSFVSLSGNCLNVPIQTVVLNTPTPFPTSTPRPTNTPPPTNTPLPTNTPIPGNPDLTVRSIAIDENIVISSGETEVEVEVTVTVQNVGDEVSPQFEVELVVEGDPDVVYDVASVGGLEAGAIITLTVDIIFDAPGDYDIQVNVDPDDEVAEGGEFNNRGDTTVTVTNEE